MLVTLRILCLFGVFIIAQGCLLPSPPNEKVVTASKSSTSSIERWKVKPIHFSPLLGNRRPITRRDQSPERNLLFIAVDDTVQVQFEEKIKQVYNQDKPIRLEDITWWRFAPLMRGLYDQVLRIPHDQLDTTSLTQAILQLEQLGKPWDLFLLTHGIPNHITASSGNGFISYKDLESLPQLKHLKLVYSQGCFSETLAPDWMDLGAQEILSFEGWNRNFFFIDFFLQAFKETGSVSIAYDYVNDNLEQLMQNERLYDLLLAELNLTIEEYLEISPPPVYDSRL
jgi:hypothetical protein